MAKAQPLFPGHYQPHLPGDLGFYDLRVPEVREAQAALAREHGIYGFCYYHYWFNGRRILERPFDEVLASGKPDFPFCLCWANENWTRVWDGGEQDVLLQQHYSAEDDLAHIRALIPALCGCKIHSRQWSTTASRVSHRTVAGTGTDRRNLARGIFQGGDW